VTPQEVYDLLHGHIRAFGDARVDKFRAEANVRLREMQGETRALLRWVLNNRETIEEDVRWAEARTNMLTVREAYAGVDKLVRDALGSNEKERIIAPGYDVGVRVGKRWRHQSEIQDFFVTVDIRTDDDKPVYFKWEPTPEQVKAAEASKQSWRYKSPQAERLGQTRQRLTRIEFEIPVSVSAFAAGIYDAPPRGDTDNWKVQDVLRKGRTDKQTQRSLSEMDARVSVPALESGEATFDLSFRHSPGKETSFSDPVRTIPGVTLETLANTIYDLTGVGFPESPYFRD
jgi:hypothetical protein